MVKIRRQTVKFCVGLSVLLSLDCADNHSWIWVPVYCYYLRFIYLTGRVFYLTGRLVDRQS